MCGADFSERLWTIKSKHLSTRGVCVEAVREARLHAGGLERERQRLHQRRDPFGQTRSVFGRLPLNAGEG